MRDAACPLSTRGGGGGGGAGPPRAPCLSERLAILWVHQGRFAQGGAVALSAALQSPHRLGGVLALSSWLPHSGAPGDAAAALAPAALEIPIWVYHGSDDSVRPAPRPPPARRRATPRGGLTSWRSAPQVVRLELGEDACARARALGLRADFRRYDGLGHEYGSEADPPLLLLPPSPPPSPPQSTRPLPYAPPSPRQRARLDAPRGAPAALSGGGRARAQEMVDVQAFFQRRIPEDAAARVGEEIPRPAPAPAHKASRAARARAAGGAAGGGVRRVRVGGVPAPFNAPWHFAASSGALRDAGLEVTWQDYQGGTASMTAALAAGKIDMAVRPPPAARRPRRRAG